MSGLHIIKRPQSPFLMTLFLSRESVKKTHKGRKSLRIYSTATLLYTVIRNKSLTVLYLD